MSQYDYDWIVVGSGFGGSVAALRLAEKGYRVAVLECGRRFADDELPSSTWDLPRYFYAPKLGLHGICRLSVFRDVSIVSGSGVGGGSLGYANTLYVPPKKFFEDPQWGNLDDWERVLAPHYAEAEHMLGVVTWDGDDPGDRLLRELGDELGVSETYSKTRVGVFLGEPGRTVPDPFFGGAGPERTGCLHCGRCMVGCPYGAKNTLVKNYLWLAERAGVEVLPGRTVVDVRPVGAADGRDGYAVTSERTGPLPRRARRTLTARGVIVAAGALPAQRLAAAPLAAARRARTDEQRGDRRRHRAGRLGRLHAPDRDHLEHLPRPQHAHRDGHLRARRWVDQAPLHADGRRRHEADATVQADRRGAASPAARAPPAAHAGLVAPHDHPAGDADAGQRDRAARAPHPLHALGAPSDRAGPRPAQPHVHPRGQRGRR